MRSLKYFKTNEEFIGGGGGSKLLKPTELEPNHVIYVGDTGNVLYDDDWKPVVRIKYQPPTFSNLTFLLERIDENGTMTQHTLSGLSKGDIIEISPCKYGFCLSNKNNAFSLYAFNISGSYAIPNCASEIDITNYSTNYINDFRGMFIESSVIGGECLDTSKGIYFDKMCLGSTLNKFPLVLSANAKDCNLYIPTYKFDTLDLSGGKIDSNFFNYTGTNIPALFSQTTNFFDEYKYDHSSGKIKQTQVLSKIVIDDEYLAKFVKMCADKQSLSFEFVKPDGSAWSFE